MILYSGTLLIALLTTMFVTPMVISFALKRGIVDRPDERKVHKTPVPRLGGTAICAGFFLSMLFAVAFSHFTGVKIKYNPLYGLWIASVIMLATGIVDDVRGLRPMTKFVLQLMAASIAVYFGIEISHISNPFNGLIALPFFIAVPLTLFWLAGVTNAINLIDGLDGLAAGVTAISAGTLFFVALRTHEIGAALVLLSLAGASLGFLRYNFFPAKIFLGDSGSYFLGFVLAAAAIMGVFKTTLVVALIIPLLILGVPIFDTMFAIGRRIGSGESPFKADDKHIHHMLLRAGFTQREAVLSIYVACFLLSIGALLMALQR